MHAITNQIQNSVKLIQSIYNQSVEAFHITLTVRVVHSKWHTTVLVCSQSKHDTKLNETIMYSKLRVCWS